MDKNVQETLDLLKKEMQVNEKAYGLEFKQISEAFNKLGNLVDLLYLEVAVLLDLLSARKIISEEEFAKQLDETANKIQEETTKRLKTGQFDKDLNLKTTKNGSK